MAKTTNISFDKKKYYKVYYSNNKDYLRLKSKDLDIIIINPNMTLLSNQLNI